MVMLPSLVPIRIDVFTSDKSLRVVDTLLFDPTVWPIPFPQHVVSSNSNNNNSRINTYDAARMAWIESNVQLLANELLADQECLGMGRTARHFTGRVDLWSDTMQSLIADQIRPQLVQVALGTATTARQRPLVAIKRKTSAADTQSDVTVTKKAKIDSMEVDTPEKESTKSNEEGQQPPKETETTETTATAPAKEKEKADKPTQKLPAKSNLIPIRIRLLVHGVRIHDDFDWDPCLGMSPLELAEAMGRDLNLSDEAVVALTIDMAEQIHGLVVLPDEPGTEVDEGGPPDRRNVTAAWPLEQRVHITNVAHLVAQHRHKLTETK